MGESGTNGPSKTGYTTLLYSAGQRDGGGNWRAGPCVPSCDAYLLLCVHTPFLRRILIGWLTFSSSLFSSSWGWLSFFLFVVCCCRCCCFLLRRCRLREKKGGEGGRAEKRAGLCGREGHSHLAKNTIYSLTRLLSHRTNYALFDFSFYFANDVRLNTTTIALARLTTTKKAST